MCRRVLLLMCLAALSSCKPSMPSGSLIEQPVQEGSLSCEDPLVEFDLGDLVLEINPSAQANLPKQIVVIQDPKELQQPIALKQARDVQIELKGLSQIDESILFAIDKDTNELVSDVFMTPSHSQTEGSSIEYKLQSVEPIQVKLSLNATLMARVVDHTPYRFAILPPNPTQRAPIFTSIASIEGLKVALQVNPLGVSYQGSIQADIEEWEQLRPFLQVSLKQGIQEVSTKAFLGAQGEYALVASASFVKPIQEEPVFVEVRSTDHIGFPVMKRLVSLPLKITTKEEAPAEDPFNFSWLQDRAPRLYAYAAHAQGVSVYQHWVFSNQEQANLGFTIQDATSAYAFEKPSWRVVKSKHNQEATLYQKDVALKDRGKPETFSFERKNRLSGKVLSCKGVPLAYAKLVLSPRPAQYNEEGLAWLSSLPLNVYQFTNQAGNFTLDLDPVMHDAVLYPPLGSNSCVARVKIEGARQDITDIQMPSCQQLRATLKSPNQEPLRYSFVRVFAVDKQQSRAPLFLGETYTDEQGNLTMSVPFKADLH